MTKIIATIACCALVAPLAIAQTHSAGKKRTAATEQAVTVTGTVVKTTTTEGTAASYQPVKTLVVREDQSNHRGNYVLNGPGHVVNKNGELIQTAIAPGSRVHVYYLNTGDVRLVDHVVVD